MLEIEQRYKLEDTGLNKLDRFRVEQWSTILCQVNPSPLWKRNRNLYTSLLLNQIVSYGRLNRPGIFVSKPPDSGIMLKTLSRTEVNSQLTKKFKDVVKNFDAEKIKERLLSPE